MRLQGSVSPKPLVSSKAVRSKLDILILMRQPLAPTRLLEWLCIIVGIPFSLMAMITALSGIHTSTIEGFLGTTVLHAAFAFGPWVAFVSVRRSLYYLAPAALFLSGAAGWAADGTWWGFFLIGLIAATIALGLAVAARIQDDRPVSPA